MLLGTLFLVLSLAPSSSSTQWAKTFQVTEMPDLRVDTSDANIHVHSWDKNEIQVTVTARGWSIGGSNAVDVIAGQNGNSVKVEVKFPHHWFGMQLGSRRVDVEINAPRRIHANLHTGDGNVDLGGIAGDLVLASGDGNITVNDARGSLDLGSGDGHIQLDRVDGTVKAHTGDGKIRVNGRFDALELKTGDGSIEASAQPGSRMTGPWTLHTGDGHLSLRVPEGFAADVHIHTSDGHIDLGLPVEVSGRVGTTDVRGRLNGGGSLLTLTAGDGSIDFQKL
ncbi:MAG TPA: DUF4097 family beta strand repeat-containing protein [Blastocatellia bacterium]|nr:DUF4097 family beta strand repeat-containing protein [Blastocatellia bacterium]